MIIGVNQKSWKSTPKTIYEAKRRGPAPPSQIDQNIALIN